LLHNIQTTELKIFLVLAVYKRRAVISFNSIPDIFRKTTVATPARTGDY